MTTANTRDCFRALVGHKVVGVMFDALPWTNRRLAAGTKALILDDGRALVISGHGTFWIANADDVRAGIRVKSKELQHLKSDLEDVLTLAGVEVAS